MWLLWGSLLLPCLANGMEAKAAANEQKEKKQKEE